MSSGNNYGSCTNKGGSYGSTLNLYVQPDEPSSYSIQSRTGLTIALAFPQIADAVAKAQEIASKYSGKLTAVIHLLKGPHFMLRSKTYVYYQPTASDKGNTHGNLDLTIQPLFCSAGVASSAGVCHGDAEKVTIVYKRRDSFTWYVSAGLTFK